MHQRMWNRESLRVHHFIPEYGDVQIDISRAFIDKLDTAVALLNGLKTIKQLQWAE